jgi:hypothetical protein
MPLAILSELFLPRDYPHSVHSGYLEYQLYDSIQGLCSYVRGTLSTSAILTIAGVGDAQATSWGAAMVSQSTEFVSSSFSFTTDATLSLPEAMGDERWNGYDGWTGILLLCIVAL